MKNNENNNYISTTELAHILGVSHVAVYKKIKKGQIRAEKIGRNYAIRKSDLPHILEQVVDPQQKEEIEKVVKKVVKEYGDTLRLLGKE